VDFSQLLRVSDYVSIHSPLLPETRDLFNDDTFGQMKPTAYLINTARGPIVDEAGLARALDAGQLAGAALDVMPQEPPVNSPLEAKLDYSAMRAMVLRAPGDLVLDDVARPRRDASQVQVRVTHSGICGTDFKIFSGAIPVSYPRIMGHEMFGEVVDAGDADRF